MYRITNGRIVTSSEVLVGYDLLVLNGKIQEILVSTKQTESDYETIDARNGYIMPGFIDIHSDYIEHIAAPRPTSMMDFSLSLHEAERELITHGITTMFHSLSLFNNQLFDTKAIRKPENVRKLVDLIHCTHEEKHLIRHRFHARYEIDNLEMLDELKEYIQEKKIHMISFMDHTPGQGQFRDLEMFRRTIKGYRKLNDEELDKVVDNLQKSEKLTLEQIHELSKMAIANGLALASHDDDSKDKIDLINSFGTSISEFPITLEVARYAQEKGMHTIAGAPNVLLGKSHSGNLSAAQAVVDGVIDILCSDYYPASLLHSVFILHEKYGLPLSDMINLITLNPAEAVNISDIYGSLEKGKMADILIVERLEDHFPAVTTAFVGGYLVFNTNYRRAK